jgi:MinD-like ATPase involved in chromosome partitioning or flagellar assembly
MIYTFYSYKGGVGRSMAMANVAEWLYQQGKRVVMIDWDLEAPGLEGYFFPEEQLDEIKSKPGLMDVIVDYKSRYTKLNLEIMRATQEIESVSRKLLERLIQPEIDWQYIEKTLGIYASFRRTDIKNMMAELREVNEKEVTINAIAGVIEKRITDRALADIFSINISDKIKQGKMDIEEIEIYLSTYALLDKEEINKIVEDLKVMVEEGSLNNVSLIEVLVRYFSPNGIQKEKQTFLNGLINLEDFYIPVHAPTLTEKNGLWLLSAGKRNGENFTAYSRSVQDLNWTEFYTAYDGGIYFEWFREQLEKFADIILIDSRTGVSEMSGVSTRHLADVIVVITAPNPQNLAGMSNMVKSFIHQDVLDARGRELKIIIVPSRVDSNESLLKNQFEAKVSRAIDEILGGNLSKDFWELAIPYIPYYNYREELAVGLSDLPDELESSGKSRDLDKAYRKLTSFLLNGKVESQKLSTAKPIEPYVGVRSFQTNDAPLFFGRTQEIHRMLSIISQNRCLILTGPPGSGKSSTLTAGLMPVLKEKFNTNELTDKTIIFIEPGAHPFVSLTNAIANEMHLTIPDEGLKEKTNKLLRLFTAMPDTFTENVKDAFIEEREFIIIIDHFEEIFTLCTDENERNKFINAIGSWINSKEAMVVLSVRLDYYQQVLKTPWIAAIGEGVILKLGMPGERELRQIMVEPATRAGLKFQQGLVERILKDIENVNNKLPLLQTVLKELWANRSDNSLTHTAYDKFGGVDGILKQTYESTYNLFSQKELEDARPLITCMVNAKTGKRQKLQLSEVDKDKRKVLQPFIDSSLLAIEADEKTGAESVGLAHDLIVTTWPQLQEWMIKDNDFVTWRQQLNAKLDTWENAGKINDLLLSNTSSSEAKKWLSEREKDLFESEIDYVKKSIANRDKQRKKRLSFLILVPVLLILSIVYFNKKNSAQIAIAETDSAQAKAYQFTAQYSAANNPDLDFNLRMLKKYYQLNKKFQENLKDIKQEIENNVSYKFYALVDTFYSSLQNKTFNAATFFNDSVSSFGSLKNLVPRDIQSKIDAFAKTDITNRPVDTTLNFTSDSQGFYVSYLEKGNVLLDALQEYKTLENNTTVAFTENFRIKSLNYITNKKEGQVVRIAPLVAQTRIDLFNCSDDRSQQAGFNRITLLLKKQNYNVVRRSFKNPSDPLSPYYVNGNEIRYNGGDELGIANKLKALLEQGTNSVFSIKKVRTVTPNILSIFICQSNRGDTRQDTKQTDVKKY